MPGPHCLIYERDVTGHRLHHVRHLTEALLEIGCDVTLALQDDARETEEYGVHLKPLEPHFRFQAGPHSQVSTVASRWNSVNDLKDAVRQVKPDRVYMTFGDFFTQSAALRYLAAGRKRLFDVPGEGHINRGTFAYPNESMRDFVRSTASRELLLRAPWQIIHFLDPWAFNALQGRSSRSELRIIPEPVEPLPQISRKEARQVLKIPPDGRYMAVVGGLVPGKGLEDLLAAFARTKPPGDERILLVGKMGAPIRDLIRERYESLVKEGRLIYIDRYVTDYELDCGFVAADAVAVTHKRLIGSSGTLVRAAHAGRMLLTTNYGWAGWATKAFELGMTADIGNVDDLVAALEAAFRVCLDYRPTDKGRRFCRFHTLTNWRAHWVAGIGRDCGIPLGKMAERIEWNWAIEGIGPRHDAGPPTDVK